MENVEIEIRDIRIGRWNDNYKTLIFITHEMFVASVLDQLGGNIEVNTIEEDNGNIVLDIVHHNRQAHTVFNTRRTIEDYPALAFLKNHEVSLWSVGHSKPNGEGSFQMPHRSMTS